MRYLIYLTMSLLIAACATKPATQYRWMHDKGASRAQLDRDFAHCEAFALAQHPGLSTERGVHIFASCMRSRGWTIEPR